MYRQSTPLFEAPLAYEIGHYTNEFEWESQEGTHYGPALGEEEWEGATSASFVPIAVERPGGGRIRDKRDPHPADLVTVKGLYRPIKLHRLAARAWGALVAEARAAGIPDPLLLPVSGYRSTKEQEELWKKELKKYRGSVKQARQWVALPSHSPHQSGRAIDFYLGSSVSSKNVTHQRTLPVYQWLVANAKRFGFYPYPKEPWHWEYNPPHRVAPNRIFEGNPSMYTQSFPLFEAPLAHEIGVHGDYCNCRECRSNSSQAFAPGWAEGEWEALVRPNPQMNMPIAPPSRQQPLHHRRNPAPGLQRQLPPLTTPALSARTKWMGSKPPGTTLYVNIPLGSEEPGTTPMTGIFLPHGYRTQQKVDILLYLHGYKIAPNQPNNRWSIDWYWQNGPIGAFREELNNSHKNVVLVMPTLSRKSNPGWLVRPGGLDRYLDMVMAALRAYGPYQGKNATVGNIILAGHSGAGLYMRDLPLSNRRYSSLIRECWGFDCMYNRGDADKWRQWAGQNPNAKLYNYYIRGTGTENQSRMLKHPKHLPNISVTPLNNRPYRPDLHHWVPITYWRTRIERTPFLLNR